MPKPCPHIHVRLFPKFAHCGNCGQTTPRMVKEEEEMAVAYPKKKPTKRDLAEENIEALLKVICMIARQNKISKEDVTVLLHDRWEEDED
jgi:hypothetical protein